MKSIKDIHLRDPYVIRVDSEKRYYMSGTTDENCWTGKGTGFDVYSSSDLENWEGPYEAFRAPQGFWADENFWAPEVYWFNDRYYMFASFKTPGKNRGTQILAAENPKGPFFPLGNGPVTPSEWACLDGTLYIDDENQPWMVFCREWLQVTDGEMYGVKLAKELNAAVGEPHLLFKASEAPWTRGISYANSSGDTINGFITDGPFLHKTRDGKLLMLWSSVGEKGYAIGIAKSESGSVPGPWIHEKECLFNEDGGHGMLFRTFENELLLALHAPNKAPFERSLFLQVIENEQGNLEIISPYLPKGKSV